MTRKKRMGTDQTSQLKAALGRRQAEGERLDVFFRDDDVDDDEASLRRLLELFLRRAVPVNLGVIPGRLTGAAVKLLGGHARAFPGAIELDQHGWLHLNHEREGRKCEFGPSRTFPEQLEDLARGQARMSEAFGPGSFPAFIPPWNRCTDETRRALDQLGFRVLSRDRSRGPSAGHRFREIPVTLDLHRWRGGAALRSPAEILDELTGQIAAAGPIGVMLHHQVMADDAFSLVDLLLETFNQFTVVRYHTFQSLLRSGPDDEREKG